MFAVLSYRMYQFAGGKDESISPSTFLPGWWKEREGEDQSQETLEAKAARIFGQFGGVDTRGS